MPTLNTGASEFTTYVKISANTNARVGSPDTRAVIASRTATEYTPSLLHKSAIRSFITASRVARLTSIPKSNVNKD